MADKIIFGNVNRPLRQTPSNIIAVHLFLGSLWFFKRKKGHTERYLLELFEHYDFSLPFLTENKNTAKLGDYYFS